MKRKIVFIMAVFFLAGPAYAFDEKPKNYVSIETTRGASVEALTAASPLFSQRPTACSAAGLTASSPTLFRQGALLSYLTHRVTATERGRGILSRPPIPRRTTSACLTPITASWFFQDATSDRLLTFILPSTQFFLRKRVGKTLGQDNLSLEDVGLT